MLRRLLSKRTDGNFATSPNETTSVNTSAGPPMNGIAICGQIPSSSSMVIAGEHMNMAISSNFPPVCYNQGVSSSAMLELSNGHSLTRLNDTSELVSSAFAILSSDDSAAAAMWNPQNGSLQQSFPCNNTYAALPMMNEALQCYQPAFNFAADTRNSSFQAVTTMNDELIAANCNASNNEVCRISSKRVVRKSQSAYSRAYRRLVEVPAHPEYDSSSYADGLMESEQKVMCMACRRIYSTRRSLTGHIGRNEKCREIIGRNYLYQLRGSVDEADMPSTSAEQNSMVCDLDPICPNCDRFISHYKGNIRRHLNQCFKPVSKAKCKTELPEIRDQSFAGNYQPNGLISDDDNRVWLNESVPSSDLSQTKFKQATINRDKNNGDPYICPFCNFITAYKGNMKRHLMSCHGLRDEQLKKGMMNGMRSSKCNKKNIESRIGKVSRGRRKKSVQMQSLAAQMLISTRSHEAIAHSIAPCKNEIKETECATDDTHYSLLKVEHAEAIYDGQSPHQLATLKDNFESAKVKSEIDCEAWVQQNGGNSLTLFENTIEKGTK